MSGKNRNFRIGLLDSGAGGLTVLAEIMKKIPEASYYYLCDNSYFPYGEREAESLLQRVLSLCEAFIKSQEIDLLVIPCNTASSIVLEPLRMKLKIPVVGVVPAVKVAARVSRTGSFAILATRGTIQSSYLSRLIDDFAPNHCVTRKFSHKLVDLSEQKLKGESISREELSLELMDIFADEKIDSVVLGCTHYSHLLSDLLEIQPRAIQWIDSRVAVANRVDQVMKEFFPSLRSEVSEKSCKIAIFYTDSSLFSEKQKKYWQKFYPINDFSLFIS